MSARGRSEIGVRDRSELGVSQRSVGVRGRFVSKVGWCPCCGVRGSEIGVSASVGDRCVSVDRRSVSGRARRGVGEQPGVLRAPWRADRKF